MPLNLRCRALLGLCLLTPTMSGCGAGNPYTELDKFRVLTVRADHPDLVAGETATLDAATFTPDGAEVTYQWTWCPWAVGAETNFECVLTQEDLDGIGVPLPPLDLGTEATAQLAYPGPPELVQGLCEGFLEGVPPAALVYFPDCRERLPVSVTLVATSGGERITTVKEIGLVVNPDYALNLNPSLAVLTAEHSGASTVIELGTSLANDTTYDLNVSLAEGSEQRFERFDEFGESVSGPELLSFTWFFTDGDAEYGRTGMLDNGKGLQEALSLEWVSPSKPTDDVTLVIVARDGRGGTDFVEHHFGVQGGGQ